MKSVTQLLGKVKTLLNEEANQLARSTGFLKREHKLTGADFVQGLIFGWLEKPEASLSALTQALERREVSVSASGLHQRFSQEAADLMAAILQRLSKLSLRADPVQIPLLRRFAGVVIEDSSTISLPDELSDMWQGCGGSKGTSGAALKLFVRWDVLCGEISGPALTDGRCNDQNSPLKEDELAEGGLYLGDLGFFNLAFLSRLNKGKAGRKRYFVSRLQSRSALFTRSGHRLVLRGLLPQREGEVRQMGVLLGEKYRLPVRLLMLKVSEEVAEQRREHIRETARKHGREPNAELLYLAGWTLVVTNATEKRLCVEEVLVCLRLRWQIERLFRLWKEHGRIDEWRSRKKWRILCEVYAKLCAMLIGQWLITDGCWHEPYRSLVKAASVVRTEANRLLTAFFEGGLLRTGARLPGVSPVARSRGEALTPRPHNSYWRASIGPLFSYLNTYGAKIDRAGRGRLGTLSRPIAPPKNSSKNILLTQRKFTLILALSKLNTEGYEQEKYIIEHGYRESELV